jgi:uncharacterized protein
MKAHRVMPLLVLALVACGSSPKTRFFALDAVTAQSTSSQASFSAPIEVGHVDLPGELDRLSMVRRGAGNRVEVSDQDRWAAPLDELVRRALTADLRARLPQAHVLAAGDPAPPGTRTLTLNVQQFMASDAGHVVLDADWNLQRSGERPHVRHERIETPLEGQDGEAVAAAMSRALAELADRIATTL